MGSDFAIGHGLSGWRGNSLFFRTAVPHLDGPVSRWKTKHCLEAAVLFISLAVPFSRPFDCMEGVAVAWSCLSAEVRCGPTAEQRAVNPLAQLLKRYLAQTEKFAMANGEGVKKGEGDDFYPQQRQQRHRFVVSAMG